MSVMGLVPQYVQHKSGIGEKWKVAVLSYDPPSSAQWRVWREEGHDYHYLPKSEYVPCDPPEKWEDVTEKCQSPNALSFTFNDNLVRSVQWNGEGVFRIRKVPVNFTGPCEKNGCRKGEAFIIELKVTS